MEIIAVAKYIRISPDKARLVANQIKKMSPREAVRVLNNVSKSAAPILQKVIKSAIANAKHNLGLSEESLVFKEIQVQKGPMFKRYQPVARGRAHPILKRTSHIKVILEGEQKKELSKEVKSTNDKRLTTKAK